MSFRDRMTFWLIVSVLSMTCHAVVTHNFLEFYLSCVILSADLLYNIFEWRRDVIYHEAHIQTLTDANRRYTEMLTNMQSIDIAPKLSHSSNMLPVHNCDCTYCTVRRELPHECEDEVINILAGDRIVRQYKACGCAVDISCETCDYDEDEGGL